MGDVIRCAVRELWRRKGRTALAALGYLVAVAAVGILVTGVVHARRAADQILTSTGTHFIAFAPASPVACPGCLIRRPEDRSEGFIANGVPTGLLPADLVQRVRALPTVADASPFLLFRFRQGDGDRTVTVGAFDPQSPSAVATTCCAATDILAGRFLRPDEDGAVMLEEAYAGLTGLRLGDRVAVADRTFEVVGIVNPGIRPAKADVYMHLDAVRPLVDRRLGGDPIGGQANVLLVEVASAPVQDEAIRGVRALLPGLVVSSYACYRPAAAVMGINGRAAALLAVLVGAGAVLVAMKTQWASVIERRRDLAILKAIGWTDRRVVLQVLTESVLVALAGGAGGAVVAAVVLTAVPLDAVVGAAGGRGLAAALALAAGLALALAGGIVAGIVPAAIAARQPPIAALRRM